MEFAKSYFGKELEELVYQDLVDFFIEEKDESDKIEFKAFSAKYGNLNKNLEGVIRGICALVNSNGGILIWGAPEGTTVAGRAEKVFVGDLSPVNERKEKDWLINKISDSITPLPVGIKVRILENEGNYVYVFEAESSDYKPHQYKNTYLARLDGQTKPAPHYLIESLFKQIKYPNIEGHIKLTQISHDGNHYFLDLTIFLFNFSQLQNEENISFRLTCPQGVFVKANNPNYAKMYGYQGHQLIFNDFSSVLHFGAPNMHSERLMFNPQTTREVDLLLSFGGKNSPLKTTSYKLNLANIDWNNTNNPRYLIVEKEENKTMAEKQAELGTTREDSLRNILEE
ncbi:putative DNA-binding protein [Ancylomarina subtilis]|uniref:Putative DNA-binding protein n=1 Tax=Ancylomarina subtilis TaxID=1639035 RepID=A0A4Q7V496_9BACT|nr:ATP-binding protein [Ancylomarina subtilis]RZT91025.1 putative DNA-binding protein [Ancylomarina subtilis]